MTDIISAAVATLDAIERDAQAFRTYLGALSDDLPLANVAGIIRTRAAQLVRRVSELDNAATIADIRAAVDAEEEPTP